MSKGQSEADRIKEHTLRSDQPAPTTDELARLSDPEVNYFGPDKGPFRCDNCFFFDSSGSDCEHPKVHAPVDAAGCCNLFKNMDDPE
jgi:hypothetical protein